MLVMISIRVVYLKLYTKSIRLSVFLMLIVFSPLLFLDKGVIYSVFLQFPCGLLPHPSPHSFSQKNLGFHLFQLEKKENQVGCQTQHILLGVPVCHEIQGLVYSLLYSRGFVFEGNTCSSTLCQQDYTPLPKYTPMFCTKHDLRLCHIYVIPQQKRNPEGERDTICYLSSKPTPFLS